ncbi:gluconate:H+ symporter [Staphylococcus sp. Mo2-7]
MVYSHLKQWPTALVDAYNADMGMVYILGIIVFVPSVIMAGVVLPKFMKKMDYPVPPLLKKNKVFSESEMPSFGMSLFIPLIPAILISISTILSLFITEDTLLHEAVTFIGSAEISLIIAILTAIVIFGLRKGKNMDDMMKTFETGLKGVATIIFIVGAGGAFKEVILEANVGNYIADIMKDTNISPLIMAWLITALIRIATGQGVVSAITAAGIVGPLIPTFNVSPVLMVLATAVGSNTITHVNDASFWLFKEYFNISIKDTFKTWGVLLLTTSITGLIVVLILDLFM